MTGSKPKQLRGADFFLIVMGLFFGMILAGWMPIVGFAFLIGYLIFINAVVSSLQDRK